MNCVHCLFYVVFQVNLNEENPKSTAPHHLVLVFAGTTSFPTLWLLVLSVHLSHIPHPLYNHWLPNHPYHRHHTWEAAWRFTSWHVDSGIIMNPPSPSPAASAYALSLPSFLTPILLFPLSISRPSSAPKAVPENSSLLLMTTWLRKIRLSPRRVYLHACSHVLHTTHIRMRTITLLQDRNYLVMC